MHNRIYPFCAFLFVENISKQNSEEIEYKVIYERNTKNGKKGEVKEIGYKIENVCYKVKIQ